MPTVNVKLLVTWSQCLAFHFAPTSLLFQVFQVFQASHGSIKSPIRARVKPHITNS